MRNRDIFQPGPLLRRRISIVSSIFLIPLISSSAIAADYECDNPSGEARQYYSEEYQPSEQTQGSYDREESGRMSLRQRVSQLSPEQREKLFEGIREAARERLSEMSPEEREEFVDNVKEAVRDWMQERREERRERIAQLSPKEREELLDNFKEAARNRTRNIRETPGALPQEQREKLVEAVTEASQDWSQNLRQRVGELSTEEKEKLRERVREAARDSLSERLEDAQDEDQPGRLGERMQRAKRFMQRRTGEVKAIGIVKLEDMSQPHVIVNLESGEGRRVIADLGPVNKLSQVDISPGGRITVAGIRGRLNERPIILARQIRSDDGRTQALDWHPLGLRRHLGEILSTRVQTLREHGHPHLLARVCLDDGRVLTVDLGPQQELRQVSLRSGKEISVLARPARIEGREALIAEEFQLDGQEYEVEDLEGGERRRLRGQPIGEEFEQRKEQLRDRQQEAASTRPAGRAIEIFARGYEFQPSQITVQPGQRVRIRLINRGATNHGLAFQLPQGEVRLETPLAAGEVGVLEFTAPQRSGTYNFYCPDHKGMGMEGRLVVQSSQQQQSQQQQPQQDESQRQQSEEQQQQPRY